jgi:hypothetical protein
LPSSASACLPCKHFTIRHRRLSVTDTRFFHTPLPPSVFHIPFIQAFPEDWTLHTILERKVTPEKSEARDWFPGVKVATTLEQVLEDPEVDAVVISTIQETHFDFAKVRPIRSLP